MRNIATLIFCGLAALVNAQPNSKTTFLITASPGNPLVYDRIGSIDLNSGKNKESLFDPGQKKYNYRNNGNKSYDKCDDDRDSKNGQPGKNPLGGSIACAAYDAKSGRLFYIPLSISELRYMDLKEAEPSFTCLQNQPLNLLHDKEDVASQVSRMAIGSDGFGYALTNDGEHLVKFSTTGNPVIQDLGVLIDNPKNQVLVRSSCTSWGGDIVGGADGCLYLVTLRNHVFKINMPSKRCDYIGMIKNLPEEFTSNGCSADENGNLLISCGTSYGKKFSPVYKVDFPSLEAKPVFMGDNSVGNISDMASSNLLFQQPSQSKKVENGVVAFNQAQLEADDNNLPTVTVFPNPVSKGRFQLRISNFADKGEYRMVMIDVNGKPVLEGKMNVISKTSTHSFSLPAHQAKGVYFMQIADMYNRNVYSQQLIVE